MNAALGAPVRDGSEMRKRVLEKLAMTYVFEGWDSQMRKDVYDRELARFSTWSDEDLLDELVSETWREGQDSVKLY